MSNEFKHYVGCRGNDPDNCSACALLNAGPEGPNYSGWPLAFIQSGRAIPIRYREALIKEVARAKTENPNYYNNLCNKLNLHTAYTWAKE